MTDLYLVRHCEAEGNRKRTFQGHTNCDITSCGQRQLDSLAERFKNIELNAVYSSPLIRAVKTAEAIAKYHPGIKIGICEDLKEINGGEIEGKCLLKIAEENPEIEDIWVNKPHLFYPNGGEKMQDVYNRAWRAITKIVSENPNSCVAAASHGCTIRNIVCRAFGKSIEKLNTVNWADNTGVYLLRFSSLNSLPQILMENDISHLTKDRLPEGSRISGVSSFNKDG